MRCFRALPALLLIGAAPAHRYTIDPAQSQVSAKVAFFGLASKTAHFPKVSGGITLSPATPERIDFTISIDAASLIASDAVTQARLKGPKFFDVARHPTIIFSGKTMRLTSDRDARIAGEITARGVIRPATLAVRFAAPPLSTNGTAPLVLQGDTVIDRRDFGMTAYPLIVGRKVSISVRAILKQT